MDDISSMLMVLVFLGAGILSLMAAINLLIFSFQKSVLIGLITLFSPIIFLVTFVVTFFWSFHYNNSLFLYAAMLLPIGGIVFLALNLPASEKALKLLTSAYLLWIIYLALGSFVNTTFSIVELFINLKSHQNTLFAPVATITVFIVAIKILSLKNDA